MIGLSEKSRCRRFALAVLIIQGGFQTRRKCNALGTPDALSP